MNLNLKFISFFKKIKNKIDKKKKFNLNMSDLRRQKRISQRSRRLISPSQKSNKNISHEGSKDYKEYKL